MKNRLFRVSAILTAGMLLLSLTAWRAFAQRVDKYIVTTPTLTWTDITGSGTIYGGTLPYYNYTSTSLPFAFKYDNTTVASGTTLYISGSSISIGQAYNANYHSEGGLGSSSFPALLCPYSGERTSIGGRFWSDDGIYSQLTGTSGSHVFTIQMNHVHSACAPRDQGGASAGCSIQIKFYESGVIQFLYQTHGTNIGGDCGSYYEGYVGLNGFTSPSFISVTEVNGTENTPSTDYQFSPVPPSQLSLQPKTVNFGALPVGFSASQTVTISSVGTSPLHVLGYNIGGSNFTVTSGPAPGTVMDAGTSAQYTINFAPTSSGTIVGYFTVITDGKDSGTQNVSLIGGGLAPNVSYGVKELFHKAHVPLSDTSDVQYIPVTNIGTYPLVVNSIYFIGIDAADYFVSRFPSTVIQPDVTDSIGIRFVPKLEGRPDASVVINTNALNIPWDTVSLFGTGTLERLVIDSAYSNRVTLNFDSVAVGVEACLPVALYNPGSDTLKILKNFFTSADYDFSFTPLTGADTLIPPGGTKMIQVCFKPLNRGYRTADLQFNTAIPRTFTTPSRDTSAFLLTIIGTGVPTGNFLITGPEGVDTVQVGKTMCQTDTLWNLGGGDLTVTSLATSGPNGSEFMPAPPTLPFVLGAGTHQTFTVCATPAGINDRVGMLTGIALAGEKRDTSQLILDAYGVSVCTSDSIATNFPAMTCVGDTSLATILVTNCGNVMTPYSASISGTNASDYSIVGSATSPNESAGGVATFTVAYHPQTNTASTATFTIAGGAGGTVALSGMGGAATIAGNGTAPTTQAGSSSNFSVTVNNTGSCDWTPGAAQVSAPFSYVSGGTTAIPAGGFGTLNFTFAPTSAGTFTQPVTFPNSTGVSIPGAAVSVTGATQSASVADVSSLSGYSLEQNYPNPFAGKTSVEITLPVSGVVQLAIVDLAGKVVQTVLDQRMDAGTFEVTLDASGLSSGTYYYQMTAGSVTLTRQMMVIK